MGSSAIRKTLILAITGPSGPVGATGNRGATGTGSGKTGNTGESSAYILNINTDSNSNPIIILSNGDQFTITGLTGPTGIVGNLGGQTFPSGYNLLKTYTGGTLTIYGVSFAGVLSHEINNETILVKVEDQPQTNLTVSSTNSPPRVAYASSSSEIKSSRISSADNIFSFGGYTQANSQSTFLDSDFIVASIPPIPRESLSDVVDNYSEISDYIVGADATKGIYLDVTKSSVFVLNTPIGIAGFSLNTALYDVGDIVSFTMFVNGNNIWSLPANVYFEDKPESTYFGCGMNIMNIMTPDKGENWYATITERGYGVTGCDDLDAIGSCCYTDSEGNFECDDYVNKGSCDVLRGIFKAFTTCASSCGTTLNRLCCSEGNCVTDISEDECEYFGGKFYITSEELYCDINVYGGTGNMERICYDPCSDPVVCCKNGVCLGEMTKQICEKIYRGRAVQGTCDQVNCCKEIPFYGACCKTNSNGNTTCEQKFIYDCKVENDEVFMGDGTYCVDDNTCCQAGQTFEGICCIFNGQCVGSDRFTCETLLTGEFHEGQSSCDICETTRCWERGTCPPPVTCESPPCGPPPCNPDDPECTNLAHRCIYAQRGFYAIPVGCIEYTTDQVGNGGCSQDPPVCECESFAEGGGNIGCWTIPRRGTGPTRPVIPPGGGGGGGGGGDDDGGGEPPPPPPPSSLCTDCGGCHCPDFPINGWMFNGTPVPIQNPNGPSGEVRCFCQNRGRDPNVEQIIGDSSCPVPSDIDWEDLNGVAGEAPDYISACCWRGISGGTGPAPPPPGSSGPSGSSGPIYNAWRCTARQCYCDALGQKLRGESYYSWEDVACCNEPPCNPCGSPVCTQCLPVLRVKKTSTGSCNYTGYCKPKLQLSSGDNGSSDPQAQGVCDCASSPVNSCICLSQSSVCSDPIQIDLADVLCFSGNIECVGAPISLDCGFNPFDYSSTSPLIGPPEGNNTQWLKGPNGKCINYLCDDWGGPCYDPKYVPCYDEIIGAAE
jgi:hypothetical protein